MFSNILVPLDGSELGEKVLPIARELAQLTGATTHLLQVISRQPELEAARGRGGESIQALEMERDAARRHGRSRLCSAYQDRSAAFRSWSTAVVMLFR